MYRWPWCVRLYPFPPQVPPSSFDVKNAQVINVMVFLYSSNSIVMNLDRFFNGPVASASGAGTRSWTSLSSLWFFASVFDLLMLESSHCATKDR